MAAPLSIVKVVTATTGTGTVTLGAAVSGFLTPAQAGAVDGRTYGYGIVDGSAAEVGYGVYTASGTTLTRNVLRSTNSNNAINLSGSAVVFFTPSDRDLLAGGETDVASGATCDIGAAATAQVRITGTTTITAFGTVPNSIALIRFAAALTLTHNGTSLILPGAANIVTAAGDTCIAVSDDSGNWRVIAYQRASGQALVAQVRKVNGLAPYENLVVKYVTAATVDINADAVTVFSAAGVPRRLTGVDLTVDVSTTGANGRDVTENSGNEKASDWYHLWVIWNGTTVAGFASLSLTPTLPSGYTHSGYVGAIYNDGSSNLITLLQLGNSVIAHGFGLSVLSAGTATELTSVDLSAGVPATARVAILFAQLSLSSGADTASVNVAPAGSGTTATYGTGFGLQFNSTTANQGIDGRCPMLTPQTVLYRVSGTNARVNLTLRGWEF